MKQFVQATQPCSSVSSLSPQSCKVSGKSLAPQPIDYLCCAPHIQRAMHLNPPFTSINSAVRCVLEAGISLISTTYGFFVFDNSNYSFSFSLNAAQEVSEGQSTVLKQGCLFSKQLVEIYS